MKPLLLAVALLIFTTAFSQSSEKIEPDRPNQTETPYIVPKRFWQIETGFGTERFSEDVRQTTTPLLLLKYGLSNRVELRLETVLQNRWQSKEKSTTYLEPVEPGVKVRLWEEKGILPKTSLLVHAGFPYIEDADYHLDPVNFSTRLLFQNSFSKTVELGYNIGVETGPHTALHYTVSPGFNIGEKWYAFAEAFGHFSEEKNEHHLDGGIAYYTSSNSRLDLAAGWGLSDADLRRYVMLGFSFRVPGKQR